MVLNSEEFILSSLPNLFMHDLDLDNSVGELAPLLRQARSPNLQ